MCFWLAIFSSRLAGGLERNNGSNPAGDWRNGTAVLAGVEAGVDAADLAFAVMVSRYVGASLFPFETATRRGLTLKIAVITRFEEILAAWKLAGSGVLFSTHKRA
ncbi:MAG: hypothetical protein ACPGXX_07620 [Planctomycetaceae bacterium]